MGRQERKTPFRAEEEGEEGGESIKSPSIWARQTFHMQLLLSRPLYAIEMGRDLGRSKEKIVAGGMKAPITNSIRPCAVQILKERNI